MIWCLIIVMGLSGICFVGIIIAHTIVFSRADYNEYDTAHFFMYSDIDNKKYPREKIKISSGEHELTGYLYGSENTKGLIIISASHRFPNDVKLSEITFYIDSGWIVLCYDFTGCFDSEGSSMIGYSQSVYDLDAILNYVENTPKFTGLPVMLYGHSLGGYASAAILQFNHNVTAAIIASGFDTPKEQWKYSIKRYTGFFHILLSPFTNMFIAMKYGNDAHLSALEGINKADIPVLIISGTTDVYYGGESPIYRKREYIMNQKCIFKLMDKLGHNGHYEYFLTDAAIEYQKLTGSMSIKGIVDKSLYMEHDMALMDLLNDFYNNSLIGC